LGALEKLCTYFLAYNRLHYAQNIPEYIARMHQLETADPETWKEFASGNFTVNTSNSVPFTRIGIDHAMEHLNKVTKGQGGISGITSSLRLCSSSVSQLSRLTEETKQLVTIADSATVQQHHCLSQAKVARQEQAITKLKALLAEYQG